MATFENENEATVRNPPIQEIDTITKYKNITIDTVHRIFDRFGTINSSDWQKIVIVSVLIAIIAWFLFGFQPETCYMKIAENRDFNKYYGIDGLRNHFTTPAADECNPSIIFRPALPQAILKADDSASSFLTLAKYGTGKTLLRCEYYKSLQPDAYLKILILNKQINDYLERYVQETASQGKDCEKENCLLGWSENEFAQLILSVLVTELINTYQNKQTIFDTISINEKFELITILCYYYSGFGTKELENFINLFLKKPKNSEYKANKPILTHLKDDFKKFKVLKKDNERLHLLLAIAEGEGFQHEAGKINMYGNEFKDLTQLSLFIKTHMKKTAVFIIDGIDENRYFFQQNQVNKAALESFCRSSVSQELLARVMANNFYLSIFYPKIEGINIQDAIIKKDKFPTHAIAWNTKSLVNYADYVLQQLNINASSSRCKSFIDFSTLINSSNKRIAEIIEKIPTPRALHYFMVELIKEMNTDARIVSTPFVATFENVHNAYEQSFEFFHQRHKIKE